jgi:diacylglycerol kinase family enzyme
VIANLNTIATQTKHIGDAQSCCTEYITLDRDTILVATGDL